MKNCNYGYYGAYYVEGYNNTFSDSDSTYSNMSAQAGSVYNLGGDSSSPTVFKITLTNNSYYNNNAGQGGVMYLSDYLTATITSCTFNQNTALNGGVLYGAVLTTVNNIVSIYFASSEFLNNSATN
jgi:predicted outer membrane repeat protein